MEQLNDKTTYDGSDWWSKRYVDDLIGEKKEGPNGQYELESSPV